MSKTCFSLQFVFICVDDDDFYIIQTKECVSMRLPEANINLRFESLPAINVKISYLGHNSINDVLVHVIYNVDPTQTIL